MSAFVDYLWSFNRKERFFLVGTALGNPDFRLSPDETCRTRMAAIS